ncbi:MAG: SMC-Scp complex subunit ScpB [Alphaproteobacteria bacterium]|nr:SMC-Scp complex subunit ScpB [Alphaproteobacteria bacterium]
MTDEMTEVQNETSAPEATPAEVVATPETELDESTALRVAEALLFASTEPVTLSYLQEQLKGYEDVPALLAALQESYKERGVNLVQNDGVWSFRSAPELAPYLTVVRQPRRKLPKAASEVLAIIAYHQPITRAEIESIRGVETSRGTLDILLETGWVRPGKRRDTPGRPLTWKTTPDFLSHFNLASLSELPGLDDLKAAGLLDTRPVFASLKPDGDETQSMEDIVAAEDEANAYGHWVEEGS